MSKNQLMGKPEDLAEKINKAKKEMEENQSPENNKLPKKNIEPTISPKLFVTGRIDRKKQPYVSKNIIIPEWMDKQIKTYCRGVDLVVLNYLINVGLKHIKESKSNVNVDIAEI